MEHSELKQILDDACETSSAPGGASIVVSHDRVIAQAAVGSRRQSGASKIQLADRFHIGSNCKAWTATMCAALVGRGELAWETTPLDLFDDLSGRIHPDFASITLEMLLRHTAAVPPYTEMEHLDDLPPLSGSPHEQRLAFSQWLLAERAPTHPPGTEFAYSNAGYAIAAAMAEWVTGVPWEELIQQIICQPLGIDANVGWPGRSRDGQPWGHRFVDGVAQPHPPDDDYQLPPFIAPAGDISVSMPHYGRFLQMNLQALQGRQTPVPAALLRYLHNDGEQGVGLGWGIQSFGELGLFSVHSGSAGTFFCGVALSHRRDVAVAFAVNAGSETDENFEPAVITAFKQIVVNYAS